MTATARPRPSSRPGVLVEQDSVAFIFNPLGTAPNTATQKYLNQKKVPTLFVSTGADKFGNPKDYPYTLPWAPSYRTEAQIYARYIVANKPDARRSVSSIKTTISVRTTCSARVTCSATTMIEWSLRPRPTKSRTRRSIRNSSRCKSSGADVLLSAATPKFAAMVIRKVYDLGWNPALKIMSNVSASAAAVMVPAGVEKGVGFITAGYLKDPPTPPGTTMRE